MTVTSHSEHFTDPPTRPNDGRDPLSSKFYLPSQFSSPIASLSCSRCFSSLQIAFAPIVLVTVMNTNFNPCCCRGNLSNSVRFVTVACETPTAIIFIAQFIAQRLQYLCYMEARSLSNQETKIPAIALLQLSLRSPLRNPKGFAIWQR
jgi:hypothetical protein